MNIAFDLRSLPKSLYNKVSQRITHQFGGKAMDILDVAVPVVAGLGSTIAAMSFFGNPVLSIAVGLISASLHNKIFEQTIVKPSIEEEIDRIVEDSKPKTKQALMIHTLHDHNGAFGMHLIADLYRQCSKTFEIERMRCFSFEEKERIRLKSKKYDLITIMAHGSPDAISVDGDGLFSSLNAYSSKKFTFLKFRIQDGGIIILNSCSAAKGDRNIAQILSKEVPQATIYATSADIYPFVGEEYDEDFIPRFNDGCLCRGKDTTRIYRDGVLLNSRVINQTGK